MTAQRGNLRAVNADEKLAAAKPKTVAEAAESGDHRALLVSMRRRIAKTVSKEDCPPRDLAALSRRLQDIDREIHLLDQQAMEEAREDDASPDEVWDDEAL